MITIFTFRFLHTWWYQTTTEHAKDLVRGLRPRYHGRELLARVPYNAGCYDPQSLGKIFAGILPQLLNQLFAAWNRHFRTHLRHNYHFDRAHVFPPCLIWITAYPQCSWYPSHLPSIKTHSCETAGNVTWCLRTYIGWRPYSYFEKRCRKKAENYTSQSRKEVWVD